MSFPFLLVTVFSGKHSTKTHQRCPNSACHVTASEAIPTCPRLLVVLVIDVIVPGLWCQLLSNSSSPVLMPAVRFLPPGYHPWQGSDVRCGDGSWVLSPPIAPRRPCLGRFEPWFHSPGDVPRKNLSVQPQKGGYGPQCPIV